ncbi:MAG: glucosamine--fructose-6-phosphate aminotransferase, partial [Anaerolineales bacterium]|nr:glucosamine--fructose-6-phosphate aminotransferase [Anaerolineales bacterium]
MENTFLYQEIHEQPEVLKRFLDREQANIQKLVSEIKRRDISHLVITARGTSDNAARYAQYLFGSINSLLVALALPSLFSVYKTPPRFGNAL